MSKKQPRKRLTKRRSYVPKKYENISSSSTYISKQDLLFIKQPPKKLKPRELPRTGSSLFKSVLKSTRGVGKSMTPSSGLKATPYENLKCQQRELPKLLTSSIRLFDGTTPIQASPSPRLSASRDNEMPSGNYPFLNKATSMGEFDDYKTQCLKYDFSAELPPEVKSNIALQRVRKKIDHHGDAGRRGSETAIGALRRQTKRDFNIKKIKQSIRYKKGSDLLLNEKNFKLMHRTTPEKTKKDDYMKHFGPTKPKNEDMLRSISDNVITRITDIEKAALKSGKGAIKFGNAGKRAWPFASRSLHKSAGRANELEYKVALKYKLKTSKSFEKLIKEKTEEEAGVTRPYITTVGAPVEIDEPLVMVGKLMRSDGTFKKVVILGDLRGESMFQQKPSDSIDTMMTLPPSMTDVKAPSNFGRPTNKAGKFDKITEPPILERVKVTQDLTPPTKLSKFVPFGKVLGAVKSKILNESKTRVKEYIKEKKLSEGLLTKINFGGKLGPEEDLISVKSVITFDEAEKQINHLDLSSIVVIGNERLGVSRMPDSINKFDKANLNFLRKIPIAEEGLSKSKIRLGKKMRTIRKEEAKTTNLNVRNWRKMTLPSIETHIYEAIEANLVETVVPEMDNAFMEETTEEEVTQSYQNEEVTSVEDTEDYGVEKINEEELTAPVYDQYNKSTEVEEVTSQTDNVSSSENTEEYGIREASEKEFMATNKKADSTYIEDYSEGTSVVDEEYQSGDGKSLSQKSYNYSSYGDSVPMASGDAWIYTNNVAPFPSTGATYSAFKKSYNIDKNKTSLKENLICIGKIREHHSLKEMDTISNSEEHFIIQGYEVNRYSSLPTLSSTMRKITNNMFSLISPSKDGLFRTTLKSRTSRYISRRKGFLCDRKRPYSDQQQIKKTFSLVAQKTCNVLDSYRKTSNDFHRQEYGRSFVHIGQRNRRHGFVPSIRTGPQSSESYSGVEVIQSYEYEDDKETASSGNTNYSETTTLDNFSEYNIQEQVAGELQVKNPYDPVAVDDYDEIENDSSNEMESEDKKGESALSGSMWSGTDLTPTSTNDRKTNSGSGKAPGLISKELIDFPSSMKINPTGSKLDSRVGNIKTIEKDYTNKFYSAASSLSVHEVVKFFESQKSLKEHLPVKQGKNQAKPAESLYGILGQNNVKPKFRESLGTSQSLNSSTSTTEDLQYFEKQIERKKQNRFPKGLLKSGAWDYSSTNISMVTTWWDESSGGDVKRINSFDESMSPRLNSEEDEIRNRNAVVPVDKSDYFNTNATMTYLRGDGLFFKTFNKGVPRTPAEKIWKYGQGLVHLKVYPKDCAKVCEKLPKAEHICQDHRCMFINCEEKVCDREPVMHNLDICCEEVESDFDPDVTLEYVTNVLKRGKKSKGSIIDRRWTSSCQRCPEHHNIFQPFFPDLFEQHGIIPLAKRIVDFAWWEGKHLYRQIYPDHSEDTIEQISDEFAFFNLEQGVSRYLVEDAINFSWAEIQSERTFEIMVNEEIRESVNHMLIGEMTQCCIDQGRRTIIIEDYLRKNTPEKEPCNMCAYDNFPAISKSRTHRIIEKYTRRVLLRNDETTREVRALMKDVTAAVVLCEELDLNASNSKPGAQLGYCLAQIFASQKAHDTAFCEFSPEITDNVENTVYKMVKAVTQTSEIPQSKESLISQVKVKSEGEMPNDEKSNTGNISLDGEGLNSDNSAEGSQVSNETTSDENSKISTEATSDENSEMSTEATSDENCKMSTEVSSDENSTQVNGTSNNSSNSSFINSPSNSDASYSNNSSSQSDSSEVNESPDDSIDTPQVSSRNSENGILKHKETEFKIIKKRFGKRITRLLKKFSSTDYSKAESSKKEVSFNSEQLEQWKSESSAATTSISEYSMLSELNSTNSNHSSSTSVSSDSMNSNNNKHCAPFPSIGVNKPRQKRTPLSFPEKNKPQESLNEKNKVFGSAPKFMLRKFGNIALNRGDNKLDNFSAPFPSGIPNENSGSESEYVRIIYTPTATPRLSAGMSESQQSGLNLISTTYFSEDGSDVSAGEETAAEDVLPVPSCGPTPRKNKEKETNISLVENTFYVDSKSDSLQISGVDSGEILGHHTQRFVDIGVKSKNTKTQKPQQHNNERNCNKCIYSNATERLKSPRTITIGKRIERKLKERGIHYETNRKSDTLYVEDTQNKLDKNSNVVNYYDVPQPIYEHIDEVEKSSLHTKILSGHGYLETYCQKYGNSELPTTAPISSTGDTKKKNQRVDKNLNAKLSHDDVKVTHELPEEKPSGPRLSCDIYPKSPKHQNRFVCLEKNLKVAKQQANEKLMLSEKSVEPKLARSIYPKSPRNSEASPESKKVIPVIHRSEIPPKTFSNYQQTPESNGQIYISLNARNAEPLLRPTCGPRIAAKIYPKSPRKQINTIKTVTPETVLKPCENEFEEYMTKNVKCPSNYDQPLQNPALIINQIDQQRNVQVSQNQSKSSSENVSEIFASPSNLNFDFKAHGVNELVKDLSYEIEGLKGLVRCNTISDSHIIKSTELLTGKLNDLEHSFFDFMKEMKNKPMPNNTLSSSLRNTAPSKPISSVSAEKPANKLVLSITQTQIKDAKKSCNKRKDAHQIDETSTDALSESKSLRKGHQNSSRLHKKQQSNKLRPTQKVLRSSYHKHMYSKVYDFSTSSSLSTGDEYMERNMRRNYRRYKNKLLMHPSGMPVFQKNKMDGSLSKSVEHQNEFVDQELTSPSSLSTDDTVQNVHRKQLQQRNKLKDKCCTSAENTGSDYLRIPEKSILPNHICNNECKLKSADVAEKTKKIKEKITLKNVGKGKKVLHGGIKVYDRELMNPSVHFQTRQKDESIQLNVSTLLQYYEDIQNKEKNTQIGGHVTSAMISNTSSHEDTKSDNEVKMTQTRTIEIKPEMLIPSTGKTVILINRSNRTPEKSSEESLIQENTKIPLEITPTRHEDLSEEPQFMDALKPMRDRLANTNHTAKDQPLQRNKLPKVEINFGTRSPNKTDNFDDQNTYSSFEPRKTTDHIQRFLPNPNKDFDSSSPQEIIEPPWGLDQKLQNCYPETIYGKKPFKNEVLLGKSRKSKYPNRLLRSSRIESDSSDNFLADGSRKKLFPKRKIFSSRKSNDSNNDLSANERNSLNIIDFLRGLGPSRHVRKMPKTANKKISPSDNADYIRRPDHRGLTILNNDHSKLRNIAADSRSDFSGPYTTLYKISRDSFSHIKGIWPSLPSTSLTSNLSRSSILTVTSAVTSVTYKTLLTVADSGIRFIVIAAILYYFLQEEIFRFDTRPPI